MTHGADNLLTSWRFSRTWKTLVVALLAVTHLAGFAHFALVQHEQCPEHGDWMHVHAGAVHAGESAQASWNGQETADGHDHCSAPTALRDRLTPRQPTVLVHALALTASPPAPQLASLVDLPPRTLWRTAPKTSPPA